MANVYLDFSDEFEMSLLQVSILARFYKMFSFKITNLVVEQDLLTKF